MRVKSARGLAVAGLCAVLVAAPTGHGALGAKSFQPSPVDQPQPAPARGSHVHSHFWEVAIPAILIGGIIATNPKDKKERQDNKDDQEAARPPDADDLTKNGPHVSDIQPLGLFAAYGFVRRGWPILIDYESDPSSVTDLNVSVGGQVTWTQHLRSGHYTVMAPFDGPGADSATPALFTVVSHSRAASGQGKPMAVEVHGLGCGPQSVSPPRKAAYSPAPARLTLAAFSPDERSPFAGPPPRLIRTDFVPVATQSAIRDVNFALASGQVGAKDFARFDYRVTTAFSKVKTEVLYYGDGRTPDGRPLIKVTPVVAYPVVPLPPEVVPAKYWDGRVASSRKPSHGRHRLQVSGWQVDGDQSWITEFSPGDVIAP